MSNPKTTILGYLAVVASVAAVLSHIISTGTVGLADLNALVAALTGAGLIAAKDGGH